MSIREISAAAITDAVEALCIEANTKLPADVKAALDAAEAAKEKFSGLLLACYAEVLARWSSRDEFTLNVTLFNRLPLHPEVG